MTYHPEKSQLLLMIYDELDTGQKQELSAHLRDCPACTDELRDLEKFGAVLDRNAPAEPSEELLYQARMELRDSLRVERSRKPAYAVFLHRARAWKWAVGLAATFAAGLFFGYLIFHPYMPAGPEHLAVRPKPAVPAPPQEATDPFSGNDVRISNVRFQDADASDGTVEFSFETTTPMHIKGHVNDERIQKVLTYALLNEANPGVRLRAVSVLQTEKLNVPDSEVKLALIRAMTDDENPGVRREALLALQRFPLDAEIKAAFLKVLTSDTNAGMRVAAIKHLDAQQLMDREALDVVRQKLQFDDNDYIRLRAKTVLQEVSKEQ